MKSLPETVDFAGRLSFTPLHDEESTGMVRARMDKPQTEIQQLQARIADLENQLLLSQKMGSIGELTSSITHEFNNILTTIINYSKLGLRQEDEKARDKAFDRILNAGQRAAKITAGLLSYARSNDQRRDPHSLAKLVQDVLVLVEKDLKVHRIGVQFECRGEPYANVNAGQIQQVILNLIVNARQAMQDGQGILIRVQENESDQMGEIAVKDQGCGIPPEVLPRIFERFYTTKTADSHGQGGTGLGLSMCREVMEAHDGRIRVETALGHGTQFTLRFPLVPAPSFRTNQSESTAETSVTGASPVVEASA